MSSPRSKYPTERVPRAPVLCLSAVGMSRQTLPSVLDAAQVQYVSNCRSAIALCLQTLGIGAGHEVLLPAYHCIAIVEPVVWTGAKPVFYKVSESTAIDLDDISAKLSKNTKVLLVVHYFGFPQDMPKIRRFCDEHGILLLEDCAHCLFGGVGGKPMGWYSDYAVASLVKFFPIIDGGCIASFRHPLHVVVTRPTGLRFELKVLVNGLEKAGEFGRLPLLFALAYLPLRGINAFRSLQRSRASPEVATQVRQQDPYAMPAFDPATVDKRMSKASALTMRLVSTVRLVRRRRENFLALLDAMGDVAGARPLFSCLPDDVAPYVFPLVVDEPEKIFPALKHRGVPVIRFAEYLWREMDPKTCAVTLNYSRRVFQFPCHQELTAGELRWMIKEIRRCFTRSHESGVQRN
jgi:perosamine synthetase